MRATSDPTETYLETLIAGDSLQLLSGFAGEAVVDDPLGGRVRGTAEFQCSPIRAASLITASRRGSLRVWAHR
jgi:hypothetical protein